MKHLKTGRAEPSGTESGLTAGTQISPHCLLSTTEINKAHLYSRSSLICFFPALSITKLRMKETEWKCYPIVGLPRCTTVYPTVSPSAISNRLLSLPHYLLLSFVLLNKGSVGTQPGLAHRPPGRGNRKGPVIPPAPQGMTVQRPNMD